MSIANLLPLPRAVFYDANGNPLSAGYVHTYVPGGTTPKTTWEDSAETTPNANPIILDAAGSCLLYGSGDYQITVTDSLGNAIPAYSGLTEGDPISGALGPVVSAPTVEAAYALLRAPYGPLYLSDYADPTGAVAADSGFASFVYDVLTTGRPGYIPPGNYVFASPATMDFSAASGGSASFYGVLGQSVLNFNSVSAQPSLSLTDSSVGKAAFYGELTGISIHGNCAGPVLQVGLTNHTVAFNGFKFWLEVKNSSASSSAIGIQVNGAYNCDFNVTANCNGAGDAFQATEMAFCRVFGSFSDANVGLHLTNYYIFGNVFQALDLEVVNTCVLIDSANCSRNTWIGGQFVWTNGSGPAVTGINATAGGQNRFIGMNFASEGVSPPVTGVVGIIVYGSGNAVDIETLGGLQIAPLSGDADIEMSSVPGNASLALFQVNVAGVPTQRWLMGRNNATESGGNVGSDLIFTRFNDAGVGIDNPAYITRSTGVFTIVNLAAANGGTLGFYGATPATKPTVTGSKGGNAALTSLMSTLATLGLVTDSTT